MKISKHVKVVSLAAATCLLPVLTGTSHGQSRDLTVYGLLDVYMQHQSGSAVSASNKSSGWGLENGGLAGSRWGLRGTESLGNGWTAFFALENGFDPRTGELIETGRFFNRQAFIGVGGPLGRLSLGHQYTSAFDTMVHVMPLSYAGAYEPFMNMLGPLRVSHSLRYQHQAGPAEFYAHWGAGQAGQTDSGKNAWGAGSRYKGLGWQWALAYDQRPRQALIERWAMQRKWMTGLTYEQGAWRWSLGARWGRNEEALAGDQERNLMAWGGVNYALNSSLTFSLAYYQERRRSEAFEGTGRQFVAQAVQKLSKRTEVYTALAHARNSTLNFVNLGAVQDGKSQMGIAFGMRHRF